MNEFTYHNIFETKGIEYILTIVFFAVLIPFWLLLNRKTQLKPQLQKVVGALSPSNIKMPKGLLFNKNHTWAFLEKSGNALVGVDELLPHMVGSAGFKFLISNDQKIEKGSIIAEMVQNEKVLKIKSPITGIVKGVNSELAENPEMAYHQPYSKGWLMQVEPESWKEDISSGLMANDAVDWAKKEVDRFKDFLASSMQKSSPGFSMVTLQDGGEIKDGALSDLPNDIWQEFQTDFLEV